MEVITVSSPLTKIAVLDSVLTVSLSLVSEPNTSATIVSTLTKSLTTDSRIDLEEI